MALLERYPDLTRRTLPSPTAKMLPLQYLHGALDSDKAPI
jgi:hypothetical protein